jgi:hypothetical protein
MKTLVHGLIAVVVPMVITSAWADPPKPDATEPSYTYIGQIKAVGEGTLDLHVFRGHSGMIRPVSVDEKTVIVLSDGKSGKLSDLKVGQWVKIYWRPDPNNPRKQRIVKIEPSKSLWATEDVAETDGNLAFDTYSGYFVSNKFEPDAAHSFVVVTDQDRFDEVFGVAFVMNDKAHRLPKDAFKTLMVIATIKRGNAFWEYKVEGVTEDQGVVRLRYKATSKKTPATTYSCPLIVSVPKDKYKAVEFIEGEETVKMVELDVDRPKR